MRLIQFLKKSGERAVGAVVDSDTISPLKDIGSLYELAARAMTGQEKLENIAASLCSESRLDYAEIILEGRLLAPIDHPDPAHLWVTGTGLTHLGSADTRDAMHLKERHLKEQHLKERHLKEGHAKSQSVQNQAEPAAPETEAALTDSMKMFRMGLAGGKPAPGAWGVQPEWFYKGNGDIIVPPEADLLSPYFALDAGEEPEIAGIYLNDSEGNPYRIGFALGNEFSDHKTERQNYLYLAHSKLRPCSLGPEVLLGDLPEDIRGVSRIRRGGEIIWEKAFLSGEKNMSHTIANLEAHHFKYPLFCRPGDAHVHFFGTATLSFGDGIEVQAGDVFEIQADVFGRPLRNRLAISEEGSVPCVKTL